MVARGPHTTREMAQARDLTPPEVSRHLAALRSCDKERPPCLLIYETVFS